MVLCVYVCSYRSFVKAGTERKTVRVWAHVKGDYCTANSNGFPFVIQERFGMLQKTHTCSHKC